MLYQSLIPIAIGVSLLGCCLNQRYRDCAATRSCLTSSSAAVNFCSSSSLPMTLAA